MLSESVVEGFDVIAHIHRLRRWLGVGKKMLVHFKVWQDDRRVARSQIDIRIIIRRPTGLTLNKETTMGNANPQFTVDPELFQGFLDDSLESLSTLEPIFIDLEANPGNLDVIDDVFRPVHSIKGNAAFFELTQVNNFAHRLETLLDKICKKKITANHAIVGILLKGVDELKAMLTRITNEEPEVVDVAATETLAKQIDAAAEAAGLEEYTENLCKQVDQVLTMLREYDSETFAPELSMEIQKLEQLNQSVAELFAEEDKKNEAASDTEESEGEASYFYNDTDVTEEIHTAQDLLNKPATEMTEKMIQQLLGSLEDLQKKVGDQANEIANAMLEDYHTMMSCAVGFDDLLCDLLKDKLGEATALLKRTTTGRIGRTRWHNGGSDSE
jgi:chemotaxis protein histidine kinase CheA